MGKYVCKISVLTWLAFLIFVFSCNGERKKEQLKKIFKEDTK
jgi:hypothetical protein